MKTKLVVVMTALAASLSLTHARETLWQASSGLTPDKINPPWSAYVETSAPPPYLTPEGALRIEEPGYQMAEYYIQAWGIPLSQWQLAMPTRLVIEARMRLVDGTSDHAARAPAAISFVTSPGVGCALNIDHNEVFLYSAGAGHGPSASVDTKSAPHTYRIEVDGLLAGSAIRVFYDGQQVLTGTTYYDSYLNGERPQILWGDITVHESGASEWYSFYHNALLPAADEHVLYGGIGDHLVTLDQNNGMAADLGKVSGLPSGAYIFNLAPSPDGQLFAELDSAAGYHHSLVKIDVGKLEATTIGSITNAGGTKVVWMEGVYFNAMERQLYGSVSFTGAGSASPDLVTINPTNALATVVCSVDNGTYDMDSILFTDEGGLIVFDVFYVGGGSYNTGLMNVDLGACKTTTGGWFTSAGVRAPALDRQTGLWYVSAYDVRRLDRGALVDSGLSAVGTTHSSADFGGAKLYGMAFLYDYAHPYLRLTAKAGPQVGWPTLANWSYQLEACSDLTAPVWSDLGEPVPGTGQTVWVAIPPGAGPEFYRVRVKD